MASPYDPGWDAPEAEEVGEIEEAGGEVEEGGGEETVACKEQQANLKALLAEAQVCSPGSDEPQCGAMIQGVCCLEVVTDIDSEATKVYLQAVEQFKGAACDARCPTACPDPNGIGACMPGEGEGGQCTFL